MAGPMGHYKYVSDDGNTYNLRMDASNATAIGATAVDGTELVKPSGIKPRYIWFQNPNDGTRRKIPVTSTALTVWTDNTTTLSLPDFSATPSVLRDYTQWGRVGERQYRR